MKQKIAPSNVLLPLLEESYRAEYTEWSRRNLRFSDAGAGALDGQKCERQIFYDMTQGDQKSALTTGSLVLFDDGRLHESDIRRRLRLILRSPEKEVVDPATGARGKLDNTIFRGQVDKDLKDDPGLEIKSANHFTFVEISNSGQLAQEHYDQIQMYLAETKKPFFICLIKNRNSMGADRGELPFLEFRVDQDPERQKELRMGLLATKQAIEEKVLPPRPFLRDSTQCQFCRFKHVCWDPIQVVEAKIERQLEGQDVDPAVFNKALETYVEIRKKIEELEKFKEEAMEIITRHFKATGKDEELVGNIKASFSVRYNRVLNAELLKEKLSRDQLIAVSIPKVDLIEALVKDRKIDASILDEVIKKVEGGRMVRVSEITEKSKRITVLQPKGGPDGNKSNNNAGGKKRATRRAHGKSRKRRKDHGLDQDKLQQPSQEK